MEEMYVKEKYMEYKVKIVSEISKKVRKEEKKEKKEILKRIFNDIRIEDNKEYEVWVERLER